MIRSLIFVCASMLATAATADEFGILNPEEGGPMRLSENLSTHPDRAGILCWVVYEVQKGGGEQAQQAFELMQTCAASGNAPSMILLAHAYDNGFGTDVSPEKSTHWVRQAAESGYSMGAYHYGVALLDGYGTPQNLAEGQYWLTKAAEDGNEDAILALAQLEGS